jgi:hypothetical protein
MKNNGIIPVQKLAFQLNVIVFYCATPNLPAV